jgi:hypothetical protein
MGTSVKPCRTLTHKSQNVLSPKLCNCAISSDMFPHLLQACIDYKCYKKDKKDNRGAINCTPLEGGSA